MKKVDELVGLVKERRIADINLGVTAQKSGILICSNERDEPQCQVYEGIELLAEEAEMDLECGPHDRDGAWEKKHFWYDGVMFFQLERVKVPEVTS